MNTSNIKNDPNFEKIPTIIFPNSHKASIAIAQKISKIIKTKQQAGKACILGLPTGSSPISIYTELVRLHKQDGLSFENVVTFNLDEYYPMNPQSTHSYVYFMQQNLFNHINIKKENINIPDGTLLLEHISAFCTQYEQKIDSYGGLDLQLLGIGRTGHVGFNEPGSAATSLTRLITLDHVTRCDAAPGFHGEHNVPRRAITMGIGSIYKAQEIILVAWGEGKSEIIKKTVENPISESIPASFLQKHPNITIVLDEAAAINLTRIKTPWLIKPLIWDNKTIKRGITWLCQKVNKPILKLTDRDYNDNGMGDLISKVKSAHNLNREVFNNLQNTITEHPTGEKINQKIVVFSPHPDDDVICMGGTLIKLVEQNHDVHVAYQTTGNIAVFDDDVIFFADFVNHYNNIFNQGSEQTQTVYNTVLQFLKAKKSGQTDLDQILKIKALIRKGEAKSACRFVGIPETNVHFLDMPFYQTGKIKKEPLSPKDIQIIVDFLQRVQPKQIYAAGDLSDPHGTHRVCLTAILKTFDLLKNESWLKQCTIWLYRGAWQEWDIDQIDMAVPLSPDDLTKKIKAIFKHQSQKDTALFPGFDNREFWQRARDRNKATAQTYNNLGLAEYEAIEAFAQYHLKILENNFI
ncbi:MAG: glucosamine-6-phosphate deaminase [bacterium]